MKYSFLFILATSLSSFMIGQEIPNGSFEEWESTPMFTLDPVDWETDNTQLLVSTAQDLEPFEGIYAMRVDPLQLGVGEYGEANTTIEIGGLPDGITFHAKWWRTITAAVGVQVDFYYEEDIMHTGFWYPEDTLSGWSAQQIEFPPIDIATTHAVVRVFAVVGDLVPGDCWISVDAMSWGLISGLDELEEPTMGLYPNPSSDELRLDIEAIYMYEIVDNHGRIVAQGRTNGLIDVKQLPQGRYTLSLTSNEGLKRSTGFIIQR